FSQTPFRVFAETLASGGAVRALRVPGAGGFTRRQIAELTELARGAGARGLAWAALDQDEPRSSFAKNLGPGELEALVRRLGGERGDLLLLVTDRAEAASVALGTLRTVLGRQLGLSSVQEVRFCWVVDFP